MSYYDIVGKIEFVSSLSLKEVSDRLINSLQSKGTEVAVHENNKISFETQFIKSIARGYVFQGITSGVIKVQQSNIDQLTLEYRLITLPIRFFAILMALWIMVGMPAISYYLSNNFNYLDYLSFALPVLAVVSIAIISSRYFINRKFSSFLQKALSGNYSKIKRSAGIRRFDIKQVVIISCSGILILALLIPAILLTGVWNIRSRVVWQYPLQGAVVSPPLIHGNAIYFGSLEEFETPAFYALDKGTGTILWKYELNGGVSTSPVLVHDLVCLSADDGIFRCLNQTDGSVQWEFGPAQRNLNANECDSCALKINNPLFDGNTIYVGSHDHHIYALDAQNGRLLWSFPANGSVFSAPAMGNGILYFGCQDGNIYALDPTSGREVRRYAIPSRNQAGDESGVYGTPIIDGDTIYAINGTVTAVDLNTGIVKWQVLGSSTYEDQITRDPILFKSTIIVSATENIYAVDKSTGSVQWKYSRVKGGVFFTPSLYEEMIYFGDSSGYLYGVNANTGKQAFRYNMNYLDFTSYTNYYQDFTFPPSTDGNVIYVKWLNYIYGIQHKNNPKK